MLLKLKLNIKTSVLQNLLPVNTSKRKFYEAHIYDIKTIFKIGLKLKNKQNKGNKSGSHHIDIILKILLMTAKNWTKNYKR